MTDATLREQFLYVVAREFANDGTYFTGFHWPTVAAVAARSLQAPEFTAVYEAGIVHRGDYERFPTSTTELGAYDGAVDMYSNSLDSLRTFLSADQLDGAIVEAPTVDRFGNVNSTVIGDYDRPTIRLPGPGGAKDVLALAQDVTLVNGSTEPRRYRDRVSYVSSPGHLMGDGSREAAGYEPGTGPSTLLTPQARFRFDETGTARLDALAADVDPRDVRETTGWDLEPTGNRLPHPDNYELGVIRRVMAKARERGYRSIKS